MSKVLRVVVGGLVLVALSAVALAAEVELPSGEVAGGFVDDEGRALLVIRRSNDPADGSVVVQINGKRIRRVDMSGISVRYVSVLSDGRLLLSGYRRDGQWDPVDEIIGIGRDGDLRVYWAFSSREFGSREYGPAVGNHGVPVDVSGDGRAWGLVDDSGTGFRFGRTLLRETRTKRTESADVGAERDVRTSGFKWPMAPGFVFLDSDGPVVLTPWSGGAYVLHFSANGSSPLAVPILFENGVEEYDFRWQWDERVLWARTSLYWRAYDLWDFGLSPLGEEPFLVVGNSTAEPHPERGAVRLATRGGRHRIEHVWRDRWSRVEENHVSEWRSGLPAAWFVSPSGRRAVVVETRESEGGGSRKYAEHVDLALAPHMAQTEPDLEAEISADRASMPWLGGKATQEKDVAQNAEETENRVPDAIAADAEKPPDD